MLANELWDHILSFIDNPRDLVGASLTSKRLATLVEPHTQYRIIRCTLATNDLWRSLATTPKLAQNIRVLHIEKQYYHFRMGLEDAEQSRPAVPKMFMGCALEPNNRKFYSSFLEHHGDYMQAFEAEGLLIAALRNMENIKKFIWDREPPFYNCRRHPDEKKEDLWSVLRHCCPFLTGLEVMDASDTTHDAKGSDGWYSIIVPPPSDLPKLPSPIHNSNIWLLPVNLTSFSYHTYSYRQLDVEIPLEEMFTLLQRCSMLETLELYFTLYPQEWSQDGSDISTADLNPLFRDIRWSNLRHLSLGSVHLSPFTAKLFFERHQGLRSLKIIENTARARFIKYDPDFEGPPALKGPLFSVKEGTLSLCDDVSVSKRLFETLFPGRVPKTGQAIRDWNVTYFPE